MGINIHFSPLDGDGACLVSGGIIKKTAVGKLSDFFWETVSKR